MKSISQVSSCVLTPAVLCERLSISQNPIDDFERTADQWEKSD